MKLSPPTNCFAPIRFRRMMFVPLVMVLMFLAHANRANGQSEREVVSAVSPKIVKIVGSGGFQGLEAYQSGFLVSSDGYILTVWSYVLDQDSVNVTLDNGQKFEGKLVGYDPRIEIAILKISGVDLPSFNLDTASEANIGSRVLAFSNLYGVATGNEPVSVQRGIVSSKTSLNFRRGAYSNAYRDKAYVIDAMTNNPGAAGGAVTDRKGNLIGLIGKELKEENTGSWVNFAIPIGQLVNSVDQIRSGKLVVQSEPAKSAPSEPITTSLLGIVLVPNVVSKTPPFIDRTITGSPANQQGLQPDDLIVEVNGSLTPSIKELLRQLSQIDRDEEVEMTVQRGGEFLTLKLGLIRNE